ncbi:MAG: hypothetical protein VCD00_02035 [Candidatus Hydrogenedentota bacterium]
MFKNALSHVQHNYQALLIYVGITAGYYALKLGIETWPGLDFSQDNMETIETLYLVVSGLVSSAVYAVAQTIAFLKMGENIERPVWKASSKPGAFVRFWAFWFSINLIILSTLLIIAILPMESSTQASLHLFWRFGQTVLLPFGATTMFYGSTTRNEMKLAGYSMIAQLPAYALICFIGLCVEVTLVGMQDGLPTQALPALAIIDSYAACFIFAYSWEICRKHREEEENMDDLDF